MIGKKETVILSALMLASIVAVPYMASSSFADTKIKNKIDFECTYENSGNGDNNPSFAGQTGSNLPLTGTGGPGAAGTSGASTGNSGANSGTGAATGGSGGSSSLGDSILEEVEGNIDERNPCIFESNVISVDDD